MIKNRLDNYLTPHPNGHFMHVDSKLYTESSFQGPMTFVMEDIPRKLHVYDIQNYFNTI